MILMVVCHRPCTSAPRACCLSTPIAVKRTASPTSTRSSSSAQPRQQHRHHRGPFAYGPGQIAVFARLDDAHARLIVIYACNIRSDRAPPRRASVRIFQNALPISVDRTAPLHVHRDLMPAAQPAGTSACVLGCRESKFVVN